MFLLTLTAVSIQQTTPLDVAQRNEGLEYAKSIKVGNNVWIGGHLAVMPGVEIGDNSVIGGSSVVTKNIPSNIVAVGISCKVIKNQRHYKNFWKNFNHLSFLVVYGG